MNNKNKKQNYDANCMENKYANKVKKHTNETEQNAQADKKAQDEQNEE